MFRQSFHIPSLEVINLFTSISIPICSHDKAMMPTSIIIHKTKDCLKWSALICGLYYENTPCTKMIGAVSSDHNGFGNAHRSMFPTWNETAGIQVLIPCAIPLSLGP
jgi:hypothetical protein